MDWSESRKLADRLRRLAIKIHRYEERYCSEEGFDETLLDRANERLDQLAESAGLKIVNSGDPRGCISIVLPSGETNNFGRDGWAIPNPNQY
jgi:hypothetical protein